MQGSEEFVRRTEAVPLGRGLSIYKQPKSPGRGSPNWYARATINAGGRRVHVKSTGTTDQREAERIAQEFRTDLLIEERTGGVYVGGKLSDRRFRFDVVVDAWLDHLAKLAGHDEKKLRRLRDHRKIVTGAHGLSRFFGKKDVRSITGETIAEFLSFAEENSRTGDLKPTTKRNLLVTLRQILLHALDKRLIERVPTFPVIRMTDNPRPRFTEAEIRTLLKVCGEMAKEARLCGAEAVATEFDELRDFIEFMVASFLRPSEWPELRHKHLEVVRGAHPHLKIAVVRGKTRKRVTVTMPEAVDAYRRIVDREGSDPEAYVFLPRRTNRETAREKMRDRFEGLLQRTGLILDPFGRKRVIYSLRHTALALRILNGDGVDLLLLSKNAGTSVRMLERFYCSDIDPAARIANLQSDRRRKRKVPLPFLGELPTSGAERPVPFKSIRVIRPSREPAIA